MSYPSPIWGGATVTLLSCSKHGMHTGPFCPSCDASRHQELVAELVRCHARIDDLIAEVHRISIWMEKE